MPRWHEFNDLSINHLSFDCQLTVNRRKMRPLDNLAHNSSPTVRLTWRWFLIRSSARLWYSQRSVVQAISYSHGRTGHERMLLSQRYGWGSMNRKQHAAGSSMPVLVIAIVHCLVLFWPEAIWAQSRGHLGVFIQNVSRAPEGGKPSGEGVLILGLMRHSPAEQSGLKRGDIIVKFGGAPVRQIEDLQRLLGEAQLGETAEIEVIRRDETLVISVKIEPAPVSLRPSPSLRRPTDFAAAG